MLRCALWILLGLPLARFCNALPFFNVVCCVPFGSLPEALGVVARVPVLGRDVVGLLAVGRLVVVGLFVVGPVRVPAAGVRLAPAVGRAAGLAAGLAGAALT